MATNFFNTPWSNRSMPERILLIGGGLIGSFILYRQIKAFAGLVKQTGRNIQTSGELKQWEQAGEKPSYQDTQYGIFADQIQTACGSWYDGTDEEAIQSVMLKMNNNADVLKLNQVFGIRDGYSLGGWLRYEMDEDYMDTYVNQPLRNKGITYQF